MQDTATSRQRWTIVFASAVALIVGQGAINVFAAGVFLKPVSEEFGLGRGIISSAIALSNLVVALGTPFFGRWLDLRGVRQPLLISIVCFALATAAMSQMQNSTTLILLFYAVAGLASIGNNPTAYSKVITSWFDRQRGLALGVALAGVGLGTAIVPVAAQAMMRNFGWRMSYVGLGCAIFVIAFLPAYFFIRERRVPAAAHGAPVVEIPGVMLAEALRKWRYWLMIVVFTLASICINGTLIHVVPLLTDRGIPASTAVAAMSGAGLAMIGGRLVVGWLIDRIFAPYIAVFFLLCPLAGLLVLNSAAAAPWPLVGTVLLGLGIGAEIDLMSYLISRYFGIRAFGALHGTMFTGAVLGNAVGASGLGWAYQVFHSYSQAFTVLEVMLFVAAVLLLSLGPYAYPPPPRTGHGH